MLLVPIKLFVALCIGSKSTPNALNPACCAGFNLGGFGVRALFSLFDQHQRHNTGRKDGARHGHCFAGAL